ncbi:MAG: phytoene desaturase family protein [Bacteroidales bacterium]|nr:phytoene desaturase family protein [Bacteroidales bacterium]
MGGNKSAIIIGAGVGGIATAIQLARNGYQVKVYEKNTLPGGRCGKIIRDGHTFDLGATIFLMPSIYRNAFDALGLTLEDSLTLKPMPVIYKIFYPDGEVFNFTTDKAEMRSQLERLEPGCYTKFQSYISTGYALFEMGISKMLGRNFYSLFEFVNLKNAGLLFKLKTHLKHMTYVKKFFKDPHLKLAFTFQNIYVGQNPYKAPALFSMLPAAELTEGSFAPVGGMYSVVEKLISTATALGVDFHYNEPVAKIATDKTRARSIILEDGKEIPADIIVANADLPYVYRELLPDKMKSARIERLKFSCSAITFHWGLDKVYPQLGDHSVFVSKQYRESLEKIFDENAMADEPCFYVHAPVGSDPSAAPEKQDSISIIVPVGHIHPKKELDWDQLKEKARTYVIERLKKEGMEDIEEHIKFEISFNPQTWESALNISRGSVFGSVNHDIFQMGYFRPHNRHSRYKNLYFVGGSTHPGNAVPLVLLSSKLTTERILKETKEF